MFVFIQVLCQYVASPVNTAHLFNAKVTLIHGVHQLLSTYECVLTAEKKPNIDNNR